MEKGRIAIKGKGIVSALGIGTEQTMQSLRNACGGIGKVHYLPTAHAELPVGEVKLSNDEMRSMLGIAHDRMVSRTTLLGALAMREAAKSVKLEGKRVVVISGTTVGGMDVTEKVFESIRHDNSMLPYVKQHDCGSNTQEIVDLLGIKAEVCTISTACSAALNAIIVGCEMLRNGEADVVIAGGTEALSRFHLNGFNSLMILDKEPCRPFCKTRAGLNLGEGAAFLVLQLSDVSEEKHDNVWKNAIKPAFYVAGYGNRCDAYHQTATSENGEGAYLAMTDALRMAGISAADIDYVNAHGTGTPDNDRSESAALRRVFADVLPPVSSTKGLTGHTTSASGAIETVICLLAMQEGMIPQNAGWKEQDEECVKPFTGENGGVCNDTIATNNKRKNSDDTGKHTVVLRNVMCNSFGFGGNDSSLVITTEPKASADAVNHIATKVVADIVIDDIGQLAEAKDYISPKEARRMGRLLKAATLSSMKALRAAGVEKPDAIITATAYGMLENSEKFLADMTENGEQTLSPTLFIQSTHNTIGSQIAIRLGCHGYNITYTQGSKSLDWALLDARRLISTGKAKTVLVGCHDEATPLFQSVFERLGMVPPATIYSRAIVLKADDC